MNAILLPIRQRLGVLGRIAVGVAALALVIAAITFWPLLTSLFMPTASSSIDAKNQKERAEQLAKANANAIAQFGGRSLFFTPAPPTPAEPVEKPEDTTPGEPAKPSRYGGPTIIAMINDTVWFDDGKRLKVGAAADGDIKVVRLRAPWEADIEYRGVEFAVPFIERDKVVIAQAKPAAASPEPAPEPKPSDGAPAGAKPPDSAPPESKPAEPSPTGKPNDTPHEKPPEKPGSPADGAPPPKGAGS